MCKTIPMVILLFAGYLYNNMDVAAETTEASFISSATLKVREAAELETTTHENHQVPEKRTPTLLVAGIGVSFMFLLILALIGVWYARKKAKGSSAEISSVPSGEPGVSLKKISTHESL